MSRIPSFQPQYFFSSSPRGSFYSLRTVDDDEHDRGDQEPLLFSSSPTIAGSSRGTSPRPQNVQYQSVGAGAHTEPSSQAHAISRTTNPYGEVVTRRGKSTALGRLLSKVRVESEPGLSKSQLVLANNDLKPVEPERRQWGSWNYVGFWIADSFNISTWMISSSMITEYGLSWWQSWLCVWVGYFTSACFVCLTGRIGATYHIAFPVVARSSFGIWGSLWPVFNRAAMACVWYGVQSWIGGNCVKLMIGSIWTTWLNSKEKSGDPSMQDFISFLIFFVGSLPAIWFPVHQIRHLFTVKAYFVPIAGVAYLTWAVSMAGGMGPIIQRPSAAKGSDLIWGIVKGVMSSIANFAVLIINNPDFARFARKRSDAVWAQLLAIPIGFAVTSFIGIMVSSSSEVIYGEPIWNPLGLLERILETADPAARAGIFVIASAFALAQLGTNIAANSVSAGTDLTALAPQYFTIRRGGYVAAVVGLVICPWNLLKNSNKFTTYLSAYSVFLSSIAGVIICDYYVVRKGRLQLRDLYSSRKAGHYFFSNGVNLRAYAAYILGILPNLPGFAGATGASVPLMATYIYNFHYFAGFLVAFGAYWTLCKIYPVPASSSVWVDADVEGRDHGVVYSSRIPDDDRR